MVKNEGVDTENEWGETEVVDAENEVVKNGALPPEQKGYWLQNPPTINYNDEIANKRSMVWSNNIFGDHVLHNFVKAYVNVFNAITTFVEPTPPTNIITNETILTQYITKQGIKFIGQKLKASVQNNLNSFMTAELYIQRIFMTLLINNKVRY